MNKKVIIGIGAAVAAAIAGIFIVKHKATPATPQQRFTADAFNPATAWGAEVKAYLEARGVYTPAYIQQTVDNHIAANTPQYQRYTSGVAGLGATNILY